MTVQPPQIQLLRGIAEAVGASPDHIKGIFFYVNAERPPILKIEYQIPQENGALFHELRKFKWQEV